MSRKVFIGVDGGGGTTECLLADERGRILGRGLSGGSNIYTSGLKNAEKAIRNSMLAAGWLADDKVISACFGLSGAIHGIENPTVNQIVKAILPDAENLSIECDAITTLTGSIGFGAGICMNAGTGAICVGRDFNGEIAISSGWGYLLGDEGSGYWIGSQGFISALRGFDGRSEKTLLFDEILQSLHTSSPLLAARMVHEADYPRQIFSDLCPVVIKCAERGDTVAYEIIKRAGYELALSVFAVAKKLFLDNCTIDVSPVGNCLSKSTLLRGIFEESVKELLPKVNIVDPMHSPVVGSLFLAFTKGGLDIGTLDMDAYEAYKYKQ